MTVGSRRTSQILNIEESDAEAEEDDYYDDEVDAEQDNEADTFEKEDHPVMFHHLSVD